MKKNSHLRRRLALVLALIVMSWASSLRPALAYTTDEVSQLMAPVALYPDALLSNVMAASTYPDEVTQAAGWVSQNGALQPSQTASILANVDWDPSVKALTAFPDVLNYMASNMDWTVALGNAFLAQPQDVYDAVQTLRVAAQADGSLQSNMQELVVPDNGALTIVSANPAYIYVPVYNPQTVYYGYSPITYGTGTLIEQFLWMGMMDWQLHHMYFGQGYNYYYPGPLPQNNPYWNQNRGYYTQIQGQIGRHQNGWQFNQAHRQGRPIPTAYQLNQGRGYVPIPGAVRPGAGFQPGVHANTGPGVRAGTPGVTNTGPRNPPPVRPPQPGNPPLHDPNTSQPVHPPLHYQNGSQPGNPPVRPPTPVAPPRAVAPPPPSLYNVRPAGPVNVERSQGAGSRNVPMPTVVRPLASPAPPRPPAISPSVPTPRPVSPPNRPAPKPTPGQR